MAWFKSHKNKQKDKHPGPDRPQNLSPLPPLPATEAPPAWTPAPEESHLYGQYNEANEGEFEAAETYCEHHPVVPPKLLSSDMVERIEVEGGRAWNMEVPRTPRFVGRVMDGGEKGKAGVCRITTEKKCRDVCLLSNLPIMAGLYVTQGKTGVYFEVLVKKMGGVVAIGTSVRSDFLAQNMADRLAGTACRPYPDWRLPGWNRLSAGLHLDDMRKFYDDPTGGRDYNPVLSQFSAGDIIGCGYDFSSSSMFYTYNGVRLPDAFGGIYLPRSQFDVYAAIGVERDCELEVNFGGDVFKWKEGNEWAWRVEGHVGRLSSTSGQYGEDLPSYEDIRK